MAENNIPIIPTYDENGQVYAQTHAEAVVTNDKSNMQTKLDSIDENSAGAHNAICRHKFLGNSVSSEQWSAIASGTFEDLYPGDYWVISGRTWRIWDLNTFYRCGNTEFTKQHLVVMPDANLFQANGSTTKYMKDTNDAIGAYVSSKWITTYRAQALKIAQDTFGASHIGDHRELFANTIANGATSNWDWYDSPGVELPTEANIYGTTVWSNGGHNTGINKTQFSLAQHEPSQITNRENWWLRDVVSASDFALVNYDGCAVYVGALNAWVGLRPYVVLV